MAAEGEEVEVGGEGSSAPVEAPSQAPAPVAPPSPPSDAAQAPTSDFVSIRDAAKGYGLDLSSFEDDESALRHLAGEIQRGQQAQQLAQYGQVYLQHASDFERWQQERAKVKQTPEPKWWSPPEYNPGWEQFLARDAEGNLVPKPGAPPDLLQKVTAYHQYRRDFADRLLSDPEKTLEPLITQVATKIAQQHVNQNLGQYQDQVSARNFVEQNSSWLFQSGPDGRRLTDQRGQAVLTPLGSRFRDYVVEAEQVGIHGIDAQQSYARRMVLLDQLQAHYTGQQAGQKNDQIKQDFLQQNNIHQPNHGGSVGRQDLNGRGPAQNSSLSFSERLRTAFAQGGVKDSDFAQPS